MQESVALFSLEEDYMTSIIFMQSLIWLELSTMRACLHVVSSVSKLAENDSCAVFVHTFSDTVPATERVYVIKDLTPAVYTLWMSASTAVGEGQAGQKVKFFIERKQIFKFFIFKK